MFCVLQSPPKVLRRAKEQQGQYFALVYTEDIWVCSQHMNETTDTVRLSFPNL